MERGAKITVEVPEGLLEKAQEASGAGMTQAVRAGLKHVAAFRTYERGGVAGTGKTIGRSEAATRRRPTPLGELPPVETRNRLLAAGQVTRKSSG
jgi:hypothetical protein